MSSAPNGACSTPGNSGAKPSWYFAFDAVSVTLPYERPWKPPRNAITYCLPVLWRASLIAPSTASVPEFVRNERAGPPTVVISSRTAQTSA